jgi:hypothetical protein
VARDPGCGLRCDGLDAGVLKSESRKVGESGSRGVGESGSRGKEEYPTANKEYPISKGAKVDGSFLTAKYAKDAKEDMG